MTSDAVSSLVFFCTTLVFLMLWIERFNAAMMWKRNKNEARQYGYEKCRLIDELNFKIKNMQNTIDAHEEKSADRESDIRSLTDRLTQINNISKV